MKKMPAARLGFGALSILLLTTSIASAKDWPQWRGPKRDGVVQGFSAPSPWPDALSQKWKIDIGIGHSSPVVAGGRIYIHARQGDEEVIRCVDADSGETIWQSAHTVPYKVYEAAADHGKGPKSTPVVSGGKIYTLSIAGTVSCHDAATGELAWRDSPSERFKATAPRFGTAMSPLVDGGRVLAHVGGHGDGALTAFDAATGKLIWSWKMDGPGYASPIIATLDGVRQIVTQTQEHLVGVEAGSGRLLWSEEFETPYVQNIVTPVHYGETIIFSGYEQGTFALKPVREGDRWSAGTAWRNQDVSLYMSSPVVAAGRLCGFSHLKKGQFFCIDPGTGETIWLGEGRAADHAAVVAAGDLILALTDGAELLVFSAAGDSGAPVARYTVADSPTWAQPVIFGNDILIKDKSTLARLSLERPAAPEGAGGD